MWAELEFRGGLSGFHGRNRSNLIRAGEKVYKAAGSSFSKALGNTFQQAVAAIFAKKEMDTGKMLEGHTQAAVARCAASSGEAVVVSQDSTYYNLHSHHGLRGLGFIQRKLKGTVQHNVFAMDGAGTPQGLLYQRNWTRGGPDAFANESEKWGGRAPGGQRCLRRHKQEGGAGPGQGGGYLQLLQGPKKQQRGLGGTGLPAPHPSVSQRAVELLPEQGEMETQVRRNSRPVKLRLQVKAGEVAVLPLKGIKQEKAQDLYLVVARKTDTVDEKGSSVFDPQGAACWLLPATCPVADARQAFEVAG